MTEDVTRTLYTVPTCPDHPEAPRRFIQALPPIFHCTECEQFLPVLKWMDEEYAEAYGGSVYLLST